MSESDLKETKSQAVTHPDAGPAYVLPFVAFMLIGMFYPKFENAAFSSEQVVDAAATNRYLVLIGLQLIVAAFLLGRYRSVYALQFPFRISILSVAVGAIGILVWIGVCSLGVERRVFEWTGFEQLAEVRSSFDPFVQLENDGMRILFFVMRFALLAGVVPIVEELFLRGWFVRWFENADWQRVSLQAISTSGLLAIVGYAVLTHPSEAIAAVLWFSMVSWLMLRTGNIWDCIVAHAVTNLLLGVYVVATNSWHLW